MSHFRKLRGRIRRSLRMRIGALILALIVLPAIFADLIASDMPLFASGASGTVVLPGVVAPERYEGLDRGAIEAKHEDDTVIWALFRYGPAAGGDIALAPPSLAHPLGTDRQGRDLFARLIYGARVALGLALSAMALALVLGAALGGLAGYLGGGWDDLLARPIEFIETFPTVLVVAVVRAIDPEGTTWSLALAIGAVQWAQVARLVRAEVARVSTADYVMAARALGCSEVRILRRHVMPHALRPLVESGLFGVASIVLLEVAVSFLGLGLEGSWGVMIAEGLVDARDVGASIVAGVALVVTVVATYMCADALSEKVDARVASLG